MPINPAIYTEQRGPNQNLVEQTKASHFGEPPGFWRAFVLDCLSVASAASFGYSYFLYLTAGLSAWYIVSTLITFGVLSVLQAFLAKQVTRRILVIVAETLAMSIVFVFYDAPIVVFVAGVVTFVTLLWGFLSSRSEINNEVEVRFFKASRGVLGRVTTAALLFLLIVYAPLAQGQGIFIQRESFRTLFSWSTEFLSGVYPSVYLKGTFQNFAEKFARAELEHNPEFANLPAAGQNAAVEQAVASISAGVEQATGVKPVPDEPVSDVAYAYVVSTLTNWKKQFQDQFLVAWVVVLFLVLRTVGFLFVWLMQFIALAVYEILLAAKFMRIEGVPQTKETIRY